MFSAKRMNSLLLAVIICTVSVMIPSVSRAELTSGTNSILADKTAQWSENEAESYDLRIHHWSDEWYNAAYIGFSIPEDFSVSEVERAELIIYTDSISASATANLYEADYNAFDNNAQYNTSADIPSYNSEPLTSFTPASPGKTVKVNISDYIKSLGDGAHNVGFRIDIPSKGKNNGWGIGSCNNGLTAPELRIIYSGGSGYTGEISVNNTFGNNMLIQRNEEIKVFGNCSYINKINITLQNDNNDNEKYESDIDISEDQETWSAILPAISNCEDTYTLTVSADNAEPVTIENILFGDLYLCAGQSNMWYYLTRYYNAGVDYTRSDLNYSNDKIRVMHIQDSNKNMSSSPVEYLIGGEEWSELNAGVTYNKNLPAVVYSIARKLQEETDVPIGIISTAYAGTAISQWRPNQGIDSNNRNKNWYNTRIYPFHNMKISGVFWYQGCQDAGQDNAAQYYEESLTSLINEYRTLFGRSDLPFYYVQLCRLGTDSMNLERDIRLAQTNAYLNMEDKTNIGIVPTLDLYGEKTYINGTENESYSTRVNIHPGQKDVVAARLVDYALRDIYKLDKHKDNTDIIPNGPMFNSYKVDNEKLIVYFDTTGDLKIMDKEQYSDDHTEDVLKERGIDPNKVQEFEIAGSDGVYYRADAEIDGSSVILTSENVKSPVSVRYAYDSYPECPNLTDDSGLPATVFVAENSASSETPNPTVEPTEKPSETPSEDQKCVKIVAEYNDDGTLKKVSTQDINISDIKPEQNTDTLKIFYWDSLDNMEPIKVPEETEADYRFIFGKESDWNSIGVLPETVYAKQSDGLEYGFYGLENSPDAFNDKIDGFVYQEGDPYTVLKSGSINGTDYITTDYSSYDSKTIENMAGGLMPIRFSVGLEPHKYYTVTVKIVNTSEEENAKATLYSERRHVVLSGKNISPGEEIVKTFNVNLESVYYNGYGLYDDNKLNISLVGDNVGLAEISIKQNDEVGKTIWMCTDSTGCDQGAYLPYYPLRNYSGVGSALVKYINPDIAVSNQGEGGIAASDWDHFNNAVAHMRAGDYLYVQYGWNDSSTEAYKTNLEKYYKSAHEKGVKLIVVSPTDRRSSSANWDGNNNVWTASNAGYSKAGREFVDEKIAAGADDIAFIDLNTAFVKWMNDVEQEILAQRQRLGFGDTEVNRLAMDYYYLANRSQGIDSVHINDYGTDNAAYLVVNEMKNIVERGQSEGASTSEKIQSNVLSELLVNQSNELPCKIDDETVKAGWAPNKYYPYPPSEDVEYQYPTYIKDIQMNNNELKSMTVRVQGNMLEYALGCVDIEDSEGNIIGTYYTVSTDVNKSIGHIDNTAAKDGDVVVMYFDDGIEIPENGTYHAYVKAISNGQDTPEDIYYSSIYTPEKIKNYLMTSDDGISHDNFEYGAEQGESIVGLGGGNESKEWEFVGSATSRTMSTANINNTNCVMLSQNGSGTFSLCRKFNNEQTITSGKLNLHFDINFVYGKFNIKLYQTNKTASWMDGLVVMNVDDGDVKLYDGTVAGKLKTNMWTSVDIIIDIDRGTESISVAGGERVSCNIDLLQTSSWEDTSLIFPIRGFSVAYTKNPSTIPSYPFEFYMTDLFVTEVETETPKITVRADSENEDMGTASGGGEYDINSDIELSAEAKTGYAFIGWYGGDELYSNDNPVKLTKVRENIDLTAKFIIEKPKSETASFDITSDKSMIKNTSTALLEVSNAKDKDGYSIGGLTASDIEWSCDDDGVSISRDGIISFDDNFVIDKNSIKEITVFGRFNNITESYTMSIYSYAYYEAISDNSDYNGRIETILDRKAVVFGGSKESFVYKLGENVGLDKTTNIKMDMAWSGPNVCGQYRTLNFMSSDGNILFSLMYYWNGMYVGENLIAGTVANNKWTSMDISINPENRIVTVTVENQSAEIELEEGSDISSIQFASANSVPPERLLGMSSIVISQ